jgi:hypothetical protein
VHALLERARSIGAATEAASDIEYTPRPLFALLGEAIEVMDAIRADYHDFDRIGTALTVGVGDDFFRDLAAIERTDGDASRRIAAIGFLAGVELRDARDKVTSADRASVEIAERQRAALARVFQALETIERLLSQVELERRDGARRTEKPS